MKANLKLRPLMIQGTGSHVGKSFLAMALCRIFLKRGYEAAPFKAQNMALNSAAVTGGEIGRAQALQAAAARTDADVRMNPLLLKPCGDRKSQVVLLGKPVGTFDVKSLDKKKPLWFRCVRSSFQSLFKEYDAMVIEGAGSPAEINLRNVDYANMRVARMSNAAVLLVGNIDTGGVFASLYGTFALLRPDEQERISGFVINKFRGDPSLLHSGIRFLERTTRKKVFGVIPYDTDLRLPEEDSLGLGMKAAPSSGFQTKNRRLAIGLVRVPTIANFTDYDPFWVEPDVSLRDVFSPEDLSGLSAVILPGSKNVFADLKYLRQKGLADALVNSASLPTIGICGGLQLLGQDLDDPEGVENGRPAHARALGLLPLQTRFHPQKIVRPVVWKHRPSRAIVRGYEIHHGRIHFLGEPATPLFHGKHGETEGCVSPDGRIWGTLTHGVFDSDEFRSAFLNRLRAREGLPARAPRPFEVESRIERAAVLVESHMDIDVILRILKKGVR